MVSVWVAVLGIVGTLAAAVLTQILTNRREFQRDQLKWAQERQQRELDSQKSAMTEALLTHVVWLSDVGDLVAHLKDHRRHKPDLDALVDRESQAMRAMIVIELLASDELAKASRAALVTLSKLQQDARDAIEEVQAKRVEDPGYSHTELSVASAATKMWIMAAFYRAELAKLAAEPVVLPKKSRKGLRLPRRKVD